MKFHTKSNNSNSLTSYLTTAVTVGTLASSAHAAIVSLDITSISGPNAGVAPGSFNTIDMSTLHSGLSGQLQTYNGIDGKWGMDVDSQAYFIVNGGFTSPKNLASGASISASSYFDSVSGSVLFRIGGNVSPDFGAGSYIGFRDANGSLGWLEVTWTSATNTFEILSGAYESTPHVSIAAGAVPEPSTALLSLGSLAAGAFIRRRKQVA